MSQSLKPLLPGAILALLAILFGFTLGGVFGAAEDSIKDSLKSKADAVFETVYQGDEQKKRRIVGKSWSYMKRSHLHAGAIGTSALAAILLLSLLGTPGRFEKITAFSFGLGSLLYGLFWILAACKAPELGSTDAAKESLEFVAIPGAALSLFGVIGTIICTIKACLRKG